MSLRRSWFAACAAALAVLVTSGCAGGCRRRQAAEVNDIVPSVTVNRPRAPLGSPIEITYTWTVEPTAKKLNQDYRAFVHFLDSHQVMLFEDDHVPTPPPSAWEPGKTYTYTRTKFVPIYPYVGDVEIRVGLHSVARGERVALKGTEATMREYRVGKMEVLPQTENVFLVYKEGWHNPESSPQNPSLERTWTKKDALVSFKNPKKDVLIYLEADTNYKAFDMPPVLTVSVNGRTGLVIPIENSEVFLKKVRVKAADLGNDDWVDLRLSMNQSFVPKLKGINNTDDRELGLLVYHLYVGEEDKLPKVTNVVDAGPVTPPTAMAAAKPAPARPGAPASGRLGGGASPAARPVSQMAPVNPAASPARAKPSAPRPTPTPRS
jgi:hypothetical protein